MSQGETGVGCDGAVIGFDRAGIEGQRQLGRLVIGVPRGGGRGGQGKAVSICQHENPPLFLKSTSDAAADSGNSQMPPRHLDRLS